MGSLSEQSMFEHSHRNSNTCPSGCQPPDASRGCGFSSDGTRNSSYVYWDSSSEPSATEILRRAHDLVAFGWCQGADATDARHQPVQPWSSDACCWSLLGALVAALDAPRDPGTDSPELIAELRIALVAISETITSWSLESWNDDAARTQQDVIGTLAAALSRCATLTGTD
jgi:hypothetical protein